MQSILRALSEGWVLTIQRHNLPTLLLALSWVTPGSFLGYSRLFPLCHPDRSALFASRVPLTGMAGFFLRAVRGAPATKRRDLGRVRPPNLISPLLSLRQPPKKSARERKSAHLRSVKSSTNR